MSTWRRLALEQFPELTSASVSLETLVDLYAELTTLLNRGLMVEDNVLVQRVVAFVLWGITQTKNEQFVHGTTDLFRPIVESPSKRSMLWRHITPTQFESLKPFFTSGLGKGSGPSLRDLEQEYRFAPRPNSVFESGPPSAAAQRER
jgi:hypothetical protein